MLYDSNNVIWKRKPLNVDCKVRINKMMARPVMIYRTEIWDSASLYNRNESHIDCQSRQDRVSEKDIRLECTVTDVIKWIRNQRNKYITRSDNHRLIGQDYRPIGKFTHEDH